ncbi:tRNA acetyltransferase TAN1 [Pseudozyma hubeiensis]|nr:tRNA acetyltransferase TAN1 [Pseudozyma hubeiensis]
MPSKRKRSGPGLNRDAPGDSSSAFKRSKPVYNQVYRIPSKNISGPGIFVTCVQSKERKAALQFIDLLNEVADRIYPGVAAQPLEDLEEQKTSNDNVDDDEADEDAMRNGVSSGSAQPQTAVDPPAEANSNEPSKSNVVAEDDIAAQIAAELKDIKSSEKSHRSHSSKSAPPVRFKSITTDTECFLFVSVSPPFDPYLLVYTILRDVELSGEPRTRFVQRLTPVTTTCPANATDLTTLAQSILPSYFSSNPAEAKTFKIDPRIRSHSKLKRNDVIQIIASQIPTAEPEAEGGERKRIHTANLNNPDLWIVAEVVKNSAAISVLTEYERYKKMNLQSVAMAANERRAMEEGGGKDTVGAGEAEGRIAASLSAKSGVKKEVEPKPTTETEPTGKGIAAEPTTQSERTQASATDSKADDDAQMSNFRLF